ncbi:MAG TPA: hypothetical protein VKC57_18465, partial [Ktedonobacterales bacterium]|nr:hypothetical protein [Ktedonobacterales bacterium]
MLQRLCLVLAFVALALAACGQSTVTAGAGPTAIATATITPTATTTPSPTARPVSTNCTDEVAQFQNLTHAGDLLVRMEFSLADPSTKLPDNIPLAPYKMTSDTGGKIPNDPSVNPDLALPSGGYYGAICNTSA